MQPYVGENYFSGLMQCIFISVGSTLALTTYSVGAPLGQLAVAAPASAPPARPLGTMALT